MNADDLGLAEGVNRGIFEALDAGVLTDVSLLANGEYFDEAIRGLAERNITGVGLHFCLVDGERALAPESIAAGLADAAGRFPLRNTLFTRVLTGGKATQRAIGAELMAQYQKIVSHGLRVTHVDSHQHVHQFPGISEVVVELCRTENIPVLRVVQPPALGSLMSGPMVVLAARLRRLAFGSGVAAVRGLGFERSGQVSCEVMRRYVGEAARSGGVSEVMVHPGRLDERMKHRYAHWHYDWDRELRDLIDSRSTLGALGDRLINFETAARFA